MNIRSIKPENYIRLFQVVGTPYLQSAIFMHHYKSLDGLTIFHKGLWTSYIPRSVSEITNKQGLRILSRKKLFVHYVQQFHDYLRRYKRVRISLHRKLLSKVDWNQLVKLWQEFFSHYSKTEFFYTDTAFRKLLSPQTAPNAKRTLKGASQELTRLKLQGRLYLNKMWYSRNNDIFLALKKLSKQLGYSPQQLYSVSPEEIGSIFLGEKLNSRTVKERQRVYTIIAVRQRSHILSYKQQKLLAERFAAYEASTSNILHGTPASPGIARGIATVPRTAYPSHKDFPQYVREVKRMKSGTILVVETTSPEIMVACRKAKAIVANQGGLLSHAAVISRELGIPCIVGTEIATQVLKTGDFVEVDANKGVVRIIKRD